jgi:hypothetical protein
MGASWSQFIHVGRIIIIEMVDKCFGMGCATHASSNPRQLEDGGYQIMPPT